MLPTTVTIFAAPPGLHLPIVRENSRKETTILEGIPSTLSHPCVVWAIQGASSVCNAIISQGILSGLFF